MLLTSGCLRAEFFWPPEIAWLVYARMPVRRESATRVLQRRVLTRDANYATLVLVRRAAAACPAVARRGVAHGGPRGLQDILGKSVPLSKCAEDRWR